MGLAGRIDERLWAAVSASYEAGNYSTAIVDAISFLTEIIRNKSGLDSDGNALVGMAFGGTSPVIKVNSLHTETERDEQRGIEQMLRGVYSGLRNPRVHDKRADSQESADILISFLDYVIRFIDKSKSPFDAEQVISSVFDKHFAPTERYADLLVQRIPQRKRFEILVQLFHRRDEGSAKSSALFTKSVLKTLNDQEQSDFWQVVSESLESASTDFEFRSAIKITEHDWLKVSEIARLRVENRIIQSIREGEYDKARKLCTNGSLATWATDIFSNFVLKDQLKNAIQLKLTSDSPKARDYVFQYFFYIFRQLSPKPPSYLVTVFKRRLKEGDTSVYDALNWTADEFFADDDDEWVKTFREPIKEFNFFSAETPNEDIPF